MRPLFLTFSALTAFALLLLAGCVSPGTDFDGLPFYRRDRLLPKTWREGARKPSRETISPVTLGRSLASEDDDRVRITWPFPILSYRRQGEDSQFQLFGGIPTLVAATPIAAAFGIANRTRDLPFQIYSNDEVDEERDGGSGNVDADFGLMPFFVGGHDKATDEDYLSIFPFGGTTKGLYGKDDALWVGFPYPFYLWWIDNEYESRHILPPFINWVNGEGHSGFRFWPFFGHYERVDAENRLAYTRTWLLWPFVTWGTNGANLVTTNLDGEEVPVEPTNVLAILPFYAHVHGPEVHETDVLYPFFRYTTTPRDKGWELRAPFPFVIVGANDEGAARYDFYPFFGVRWRPGYIRHFVLAPFERYERREDEWVSDTSFWFLPFIRYNDHLDKKRKTESSFFQFWPFFHHRKLETGETDTRALSIFPFTHEDLEEIFLPFVSLYRHREIPELGSSETSVLLNIASWRKAEPAGGEDYERLSLLFGMFQYRRKGREKALRFFYLTDWPVWEAAE